MQAKLYRWAELACDHPKELADRRRVIGEQAMLSHLLLHQGFSVPVHAHENEQFAVVLEGCLRFTLVADDGSEYTKDVRGGEVLYLASNVPHGAEALVTSTVLDIFSPPSEMTGVDTAGARG